MSAETVMATAMEKQDSSIRIQDRTSYDDRLDLQDSSSSPFAKLPPSKAIPPPSDDVANDPDYANSLPILPAQPQVKHVSTVETTTGDKPVYVVHFVLGDKDPKGKGKQSTTTKRYAQPARFHCHSP